MTERLRFGVVGCGAFSTVYQLPALSRAATVQLAAVVDMDHAWAGKVARRFRVPQSYSDHRALSGRVDAALVATPNTTHADIVCALLEEGIHVLCEKPLATTRTEVERMLDVSARTGARLMAAHCLRFSPNLDMLKQLASAEWLGPLTEISGGIGGGYDAGRTDFRRQRRLSGGGVLVDLGIHLIDLAIWLAGEAPLSVRYDGHAADGWEVETDAEVALEFSGGARALLASSFTHSLEPALTVRGQDGWASAPLYRPGELGFFSHRARICERGGVQRIILSDTTMYDRQIEHFCDAILTGKPFTVRPDEVRAAVAVVERCYANGQHAEQ
jgi:predicted dehydrogenase